MVILDTSIIIDHLRRPPEESVLIQLFEHHTGETFGISVVTIQELYEGKSTRDERKEHHLLSTLGSLEILPYNTEVAKIAGKIARDVTHPIDFADAAIAATAITSGGALCTLNEKHFKNIPHLELVEPRGSVLLELAVDK